MPSRFEKQLAFARTKQRGTYLQKYVAKDLQKAIRAEAGAYVGMVKFVRNGVIGSRLANSGEVFCVTCGKGPMMWNHKGTHAGHFIGGRSEGVVLEEVGIHVQCYPCNAKEVLAGNPAQYRIYMQKVYGQDVVDDLERRKNGWFITEKGEEKRLEKRSLERLVELRLGYMDRVKKAVQKMERA